MWTFLLLGCPDTPPTPRPCRKLEDPPTCTLMGRIDGVPTADRTFISGGVQGGIHLDLAVDFTEVGSVVRTTTSILDVEGNEYAVVEPVDLVTDADDDCTASPEVVRAILASIDGCDLAGEQVTVSMEAERSDGQVASCSADLVLEIGPSAWLCDDQ